MLFRTTTSSIPDSGIMSCEQDDGILVFGILSNPIYVCLPLADFNLYPLLIVNCIYEYNSVQ